MSMRAFAIVLITGTSFLLSGCFYPGPGYYGPPGPAYGYGYGEVGLGFAGRRGYDRGDYHGVDRGGRGGDYHGGGFDRGR